MENRFYDGTGNDTTTLEACSPKGAPAKYLGHPVRPIPAAHVEDTYAIGGRNPRAWPSGRVDKAGTCPD